MRTLVLLLPFFAACGEPAGTSCTEIGCASLLTLHVTDAGDPPVGLNGTVTVGDRTYTIDCDGTSDPEVSCSGSDVAITIAEDEGGGDVTWQLHAGDPNATQGGGYVGNDTVTPDWSEDHPNGEDCPPTCWSGEIDAPLFGTP